MRLLNIKQLPEIVLCAIKCFSNNYLKYVHFRFKKLFTKIVSGSFLKDYDTVGPVVEFWQLFIYFNKMSENYKKILSSKFQCHTASTCKLKTP